MHPAVASLTAIVLALGATEAMAYWWMHPPPAGLDQPVLCYRPSPSRSAGVPPASGSERPDTSFTYTHLPDLVAKSLRMLRCSNGSAARVDRDDGATIHLAFFEWDQSDSTSVLEAFKHLPEQCLGSLGLTLTGHLPPRSYQIAGESLDFDHSVFRDPAGGVVHAFKGTWISGMSSLIGNGFRGGADHLRQIRWKAALKRFHPAYACVAQGAVRGISDPDLAWQAFERAMLSDLSFAPARH